MDTLVLNKDAQPISILPLSAIGWQEAIKYMWLDRVHVLEWYDDWIVRSPTWETPGGNPYTKFRMALTSSFH